MNMDWTPERRERIAGYLKQKMSASQIAKYFGCSRSAIIGLVGRDKNLKAIGLRHRRVYERGNVVQFKPRPRAVRELAPPASVKLRVVTNNTDMMINDWLLKNGGPRRFEPWDTADYYNIKSFLEDRGYTVTGGWQGYTKITKGTWRSKNLTLAGVREFVDDIREQEGLPTFSYRRSALDRRKG